MATLDEGEHVAALVELLDVWALTELGRVEDAVQLLQQGLYREPGSMELRRELIALHRRGGRLDLAARELSMLLWSEPSAENHIELARLYLELREHGKAVDEVEKALALDPDHVEAQRLREELFESFD